MATPLLKVINVLNILKSDDVEFSNTTIPDSYAELGIIQCSISLGKDFTIIDNDGVLEIQEDITSKEIYLAGLYSYRNYILNEHEKITTKAVNFKTINFAVSGLTERAKEVMRIIWWCDNEIQKVLSQLIHPMGTSAKMVIDND